jgi:hypothetical protein
LVLFIGNLLFGSSPQWGATVDGGPLRFRSVIFTSVFTLGFLFQGTTTPNCLDALDTSDDGQVNIADPVALLGYLFASAPPPPAPFSLEGPDRTADGLLCLP